MRAPQERLDYLDAVRAFALTLGIVFHAGLSFLPVAIGWAVMDVSTSPVVAIAVLVSHSFRMELFFLIAGFFSHMTYHRVGLAGFLRSRFTRLVVPFVVGWFVLRPLLVSGWIMGYTSVRGEVDIAAGLKGGVQSLAAMPLSSYFAGTHLWFLYYLCMITSGVVALSAARAAIGHRAQRLVGGADAAFAWLGASRFAILVLAVPTAGALWFMRGWGMDTPDQTLRPHLPVLLVYGGFFAFGWLLHRNVHLIPAFTRMTSARWIVAGAAIVVTVLLSGIERDWGHPDRARVHLVYVLSYAVMMWSLVFLTIGAFQRLMHGANRAVRYLADASYWLYLIHLPIVVWLQVAVAELPVHWSVKILGISVATIGIALVTYDLCVRATFVGRILNGRRRPRCLFGHADSSPETSAADDVVADRRPLRFRSAEKPPGP